MKVNLISTFLVSLSLMGSATGTLADDKVDFQKLKSDCETLPPPSLPAHARNAFTSALYEYGAFSVFKANNFSEDELREFDPKLISLVQELHKPTRYGFVKNDLEAKAQEAIANLNEIVGPASERDERYFERSLVCFAINVYSERDSLEHQHVMFVYQQEISQADHYTGPNIEGAQLSRELRAEKGTSSGREQPLITKSTPKTEESSNPNAQYLLGMKYDTGEGGMHNPQKAMFWYRKSAEQGHGPAQYWLASHYLTGDGVPKDGILAYVWFSVSAANGYYPAVAARDLYGSNLSQSQKNAGVELANQYYKKYRPHN